MAGVEQALDLRVGVESLAPSRRPCSISQQSMSRLSPNIGAQCLKKMNFWTAGDNLWHSHIVFTVEATPQL